MKIRKRLRFIIKNLIHLSIWRRFVFPRWRYNFSASDLVFLCGCLERTKAVQGAILEIGCEYGETTIFLNQYLKDTSQAKKYICIDTFDGFVLEDIKWEVSNRGKKESMLQGFQGNSEVWLRKTLDLSGHADVAIVKADANNFDFLSLGSLAFTLIDVDLYKPVLKSLESTYSQLLPGGIIVVDDCDPLNSHYDGAYYAYTQFCNSNGISPLVIGRKLGVIYN